MEKKYEDWQQLIKDLNQGQPDLLELVQNQIDQYEKEKGK